MLNRTQTPQKLLTKDARNESDTRVCKKKIRSNNRSLLWGNFRGLHFHQQVTNMDSRLILKNKACTEMADVTRLQSILSKPKIFIIELFRYNFSMFLKI